MVCCQVVHTMWCVQEVDCMVCCQVVHTMWCVQEVDCMMCCQCACGVYRKLIAWCVVRWSTPCDVYRKWGHHTQPWNPALWQYPCVNSDQHSYVGRADFYTLCFIPSDCEELGLGWWYIAWDMYCYFGGFIQCVINLKHIYIFFSNVLN